MKGIMFTTFIQIAIGICLCTFLVASTDVKNETSTTTAKPSDLSEVETRHFEASVQHLRPGESASRSISHSYSQSNQDVAFRNPAYEKGGYEAENPAEYGKSQHDEYYPDNKDNSYHQHDQQKQPRYPHSEDYSNSYDGSYQQQHGKDAQSYEERDHQGDPYSYPDPSVKGQTSYEHQDYTKENSDESGKDGSYGKGRPPFHYAYEISHPDKYGSLDASHNAAKPGYGSGEIESYSPKVLQQGDYYSKPVPNSYVPQEIYKDDYSSVEHKGDYFPSIPKEAGYASNGKNEPGFLQGPQHEPSYSKQAGYSAKEIDNSAWVPVLPKSEPSALKNDGKVSVYIKHLGHKTSGHDGNGERQGFLLLPVIHEKMEEKLKEIKGSFRHEFRKNYGDDKPLSVGQSHYPTSGKQIYPQTKVIQYPVDAKFSTVQHVPAYHNQEPVKPHGKSIHNQDNYGALKVIVKNEAYGNAGYESPKVKHEAYGNAGYEIPKVKNEAYGYGGYESPKVKHEAYGNAGYEIPKVKNEAYEYGGYESPKVKNEAYGNAGYDRPKGYAIEDKSIEHSAPYAPQVVSHYEAQPEVKTYSKDALVYNRPHKGNPGFAGVPQYDTVYAKTPKYVPAYDIIPHPKSVPIKIKGYPAPTYSSLYRARSYPRIVDLSYIAGKARSGPSHAYSAHYKNVGIPVSAYEHAALKVSQDQEKSVSLLLKKQKESEVDVFKPSPYSLKGRVSAKDLVEDFGLHDYESLLSAQRHGAGPGHSLYYDLHTFPAQHAYAPFSYRRSGLIPKKSHFEV